jgi:hypothetical protein
MEPLRKFMQIIRDNGGIRSSLYKLYRQNDLKDGTYVGSDEFGNKYYENNRYFFPRNRWVEYHPKFGTDFDARYERHQMERCF